MKKVLWFCLSALCVLNSYAQTPTGDQVLAFVRDNLPSEPLKLTGTLKVKAKNGFTRANIPAIMELDWGATAPTARYRIGEPNTKEYEALTITWNNDTPSYAFSNTKNKPTSTVLDTGITWADLSFSVLWWPNAKLTGEEKKINRDCYVVEVPVPDSKNSMRLWIEKNMGMLLEARTLDAKGKELSRLKIVSIKKMDGMWIAKDLELSDKKTGSTTTLQIHDLEWINGPPVTETTEETSAEAFSPANSINQLAVDLYGKLAKETDGNLFLSPYSISSALAMTYGGARGNTAAQMNKVLHFGGPEVTHPAFSYLRRSLDKIAEKGDVQLNVANALWPQKDYAFLPDYLALTKMHYASEVRPTDYKTNAEGVRQKINTWVEEQTNDKIKDLIPKGSLDPFTRLVLVNAIYFKGNWAEQFDPDNTREAPFHVNKEETVQVPMMSKKADFKLAETESLQALELPYEGNELSMLILLPTETNTLAALEKELSPDMLSALPFRKTELTAQLPKFKLESSFELGTTLQQMGMTDAFGNADFSGMDGTKNLSISAVVHKAYVDVNEEGTEAAAATGVVMRLTAVRNPKIFRADRPFLFCIRENASGTLLFIGRMMNPEA